ncbi:hypothetical protein ODU72_04845 [Lactobacillus amylovorus]|uniref:Uncharacterized protein n=1 Tax=Lactobacillus amylovorus TaxID=1604 RepID=A0A9X3W493_LACAM|nr:hypothetical protein [Lactobacillus amylovorus]MDB6258006.1 hypothetical protein [Lactobacillus amylovorus]
MTQKELQRAIENTQQDNKPMNNYSRAVVYVDGKIAAIITNNEIVQDDNVDVRLKPVYDN